jgi:hypothetical protein
VVWYFALENIEGKARKPSAWRRVFDRFDLRLISPLQLPRSAKSCCQAPVMTIHGVRHHCWPDYEGPRVENSNAGPIELGSNPRKVKLFVKDRQVPAWRFLTIAKITMTLQNQKSYVPQLGSKMKQTSATIYWRSSSVDVSRPSHDEQWKRQACLILERDLDSLKITTFCVWASHHRNGWPLGALSYSARGVEVLNSALRRPWNPLC